MPLAMLLVPPYEGKTKVPQVGMWNKQKVFSFFLGPSIHSLIFSKITILEIYPTVNLCHANIACIIRLKIVNSLRIPANQSLPHPLKKSEHTHTHTWTISCNCSKIGREHISFCHILLCLSRFPCSLILRCAGYCCPTPAIACFCQRDLDVRSVSRFVRLLPKLANTSSWVCYRYLPKQLIRLL